MADGGFDPCECVFSHEAAMRRLLSLLRNAQNYCTDDGCVQELPGPSQNGSLFDGTNSLFMMLMMWMAAALFLFYMRPQSMRRSRETKELPEGPHDRRDEHEDPPPVM